MPDSIDTKSSLYNPDLAPTPIEKRTWSSWNFIALWIGMVIAIPQYILASGLIARGMNWAQALTVIFITHLVILIPITLNGYVGAKYGIPFPVFLRSIFGLFGATIPATLRALVACGWFGINAWVGGSALYGAFEVILNLNPQDAFQIPLLGLSFGQLICFLAFGILNIVIFVKGMDSVKWLQTLSSPLLITFCLALFGWAWWKVGGLGPMLWEQKDWEQTKPLSQTFFPGLVAVFGSWGTLALNIGDFTRFAKSQRSQIVGQAIALPIGMLGFAFLGVAITGATIVIFNEAIWNPIFLIQRLDSPLISIVGQLTIVIATLSTNVAANLVCSANDLSNLFPSKISIRTGAIITGTIGFLIFPWKVMSTPDSYVFLWLLGYGIILSPILGIMLTHYFIIQKRQLTVAALYEVKSGPDSYPKFNKVNLVALALGICIGIPGFMTKLGILSEESVLGIFHFCFNYAWFSGMVAGAFLCYAGNKLFKP